MENTELIIPAPSDPLKKHKSHFSKIGLFYFCGAIIISGVQISVITLIQLIAPQLMVNPNISLIISSLSMYLIAMPLLVIIVRTIPGMVVLSPADDVEARAAVKAAYEHKGPVYIRFGRAAVPVIHEEENYSFEIGKAEVLRPGTDVAVAATGLMVAEALKAAETLAAEGINVRVINVCSIKPLDEETILAAARECGKIVTCEEHSIIGGLGEAVCSLVSEKHPVPVRRVGVNDEFGHSGPAAALLEEMGLCASHIAEVVRETVKG